MDGRLKRSRHKLAELKKKLYSEMETAYVNKTTAEQFRRKKTRGYVLNAIVVMEITRTLMHVQHSEKHVTFAINKITLKLFLGKENHTDFNNV